jgi:NAD(P)-dependent dehydrogenase (short-subunit alcohol dehydrogenase family)
VTSPWIARFPDLAGKVAVVAGESSYLTDVVEALATNGALLAVVAPLRSTVDTAVARAEQLATSVIGMTADPSDPGVWDRITPHIEQRLGPIDVAVTIAAAGTRRVIVDALLPDMAARQRGVVVEIGSSVVRSAPPPGVRHRGVQGDTTTTASDLAAAVLLCASDIVTAASLLVSLGQPTG